MMEDAKRNIDPLDQDIQVNTAQCSTKKELESINELQTSDSKNSDAQNDTDYIEELEALLQNLGLPEPYYDLMVKKEKHNNLIKLTYVCCIKINEKYISSSYPVECRSENYAKIVSVKHALNILKQQYGDNVIYPITNDINTIASRIKEFMKLESEHDCLENDVLENMYRSKYQENLPENWFELLKVYSYFEVTKNSNNTSIYLNETSNHNLDNSIVPNKCYENPEEEHVLVPGTPLTLEDYEEKSVFVSANYGSTSVWIRLVGQNADENFIQMQAEFNNFMNTSGFSIAEQPSEGEFYAVLYNKLWHRVQYICEATEDDGMVTCFMVDTGEQLNISKDQICCMEPVFMKTKTQAIECTLAQLDNFSAFDGLKELLDEMILNKTFFLTPDSFEEGYIRVTLYEKGEGSNRINVNDLIIQKLLEKSIVRLPSFEENTVVDGNVSAINESGYLYLQLKFNTITSLEEILPNDECLLPDYFLRNKEDIKANQVYLTKYYDGDEASWGRVQILEVINDVEVKVIFIDYGNNAKSKITELVDLDLFDPLMSKIPPQAIKVYMNLIPPKVMTAEIAEKILTIIENEKVLVNLVNAPLNDVPCVQLYKIHPNSPEETICINIMIFQSLRQT